MDPFTPDHLFQSLRDCGLYGPEKLAILDTIPAETKSDPAALGEFLWKEKLLTAYQTRKVRLNRLSEILFGQYLVLDKIGEGGMGKVFKAVQSRSGRQVALKVVRAHLMANKTVVGRYKREAAAAAKLNHPNIVTLLDADEAQGRYFLAMEFVYGSDLSRMVKEYGPLPAPEAAEYIRQAALGLQHAHDHGLIHRDIKPSNMLVSGERALPGTDGVAVVRILDMGLVRSLVEDDADAARTELTRDGTVVGTPDYMAPEQAKNSSTVDHRADIYSLGCSLYYLLAGKPPFTEGTPIDKLLRHQLDPPPDIRKQRPDVPEELMRAMLRMMAKRPEDRIPSAGEVAKILARHTAEGIANVPEIILTMPDHVPSPGGSVIPTGDTKPMGAVQVLEAEVVSRRLEPAARVLPARKKSVKLVPREVDSGDSMPIANPSSRRDSSEDTRSQEDSDEIRPRSRESEAAQARLKRQAKARLANRKKKQETNWVPIAVGMTCVAVLAIAGWLIFRPRPEPPAPVVEKKAPVAPAPVVQAGLPPVWVNIPDTAAAVAVVYPEALWPVAKDALAAQPRTVRTINHLASKYQFDLRSAERFTVAFTPGRIPGYCATADGAFLTLDWIANSAKWPDVKLSKLNGMTGAKFESTGGTKLHGLFGGNRKGYTLTNEESLLLDLVRREADRKPNLPAELLAALPESTDPNRPAFTFVATGNWNLPEGLALGDFGIERLILQARFSDDRFNVELELCGRTKALVSDFVNIKLWDTVKSKYPAANPLLSELAKNTANDGWDTIGDLHRLRKSETGVWEISQLVVWLEKLMPAN